MIKRKAKLRFKRISLSKLRVFEYQKRYPDRLLHYIELLKANIDDDPGIIYVKKRKYGYEILDGHHRYCALVMSGRPDALCLIISE